MYILYFYILSIKLIKRIFICKISYKLNLGCTVSECIECWNRRGQNWGRERQSHCRGRCQGPEDEERSWNSTLPGHLHLGAFRLCCGCYVMWKWWVGIRWRSQHTTVHFPFAFVFIISGVPKCFVLCVLSPCTFPFPLPSSFQVKASIPFFWLLFCVSFLFGLRVLRSPTRVYNFSCFTVVVRFFFCMCPLLRRLFI